MGCHNFAMRILVVIAMGGDGVEVMDLQIVASAAQAISGSPCASSTGKYGRFLMFLTFLLRRH